MNIVFLGAPGTGKGTVAARMAADQKFTHIAPGNLFRDEVKNASSLGKKIKEMIETGVLVPDEITNQLIKKHIKKNNIFDGYPRTLNQADVLEKLVKLDKVILFDMSEEQIVKRLGGRRTCPNCQAIYHMVTMPPKNVGKCDRCMATLVQRKDDAPDVVKHRFNEFHQKTAPLIDFYKQKKLLFSVDAGHDVDTVFNAVKKIVKK
ncbi:MAG TPA: nucleoside monophosphate kinase [Candidatus Nanoarchaeia archaeon]|nr:nucleoside monophosphate kinase [Candidatus Nanoarchaeia archaeon]